MHIILLSFLASFVLVYISTPAVIRIARKKHLMDVPLERSSHTELTPSLGGIPIFLGTIFSLLLLAPSSGFTELQYVLCSLVVIFMIGAKDDIEPLRPHQKLIGQLAAAVILTIKGGVVLEGLYGLGGSSAAFPPWLAFGLTVFVLLTIINSFNLIDGINGLAGGVGALICITFGCWFLVTGSSSLATLALALAGALLAFLRYNLTPARIFMGDTGSLIVGTVCGILAIEFIDRCAALPPGSAAAFRHPIAVAAAVLIVPLFDTARVFITRIFRGHSPFSPDRRHIHHLLIDYGHSHLRATGILLLLNVLLVSLIFLLDPFLGLHVLLLIEIAVAGGLTFFLHRRVVRRNLAILALTTPDRAARRERPEFSLPE